MDDRVKEAAEFAAIIVGSDGIAEDGPAPGTPLAKVLELTRRLEAEGLPEAEVDRQVKDLWSELWAGADIHPEYQNP